MAPDEPDDPEREMRWTRAAIPQRMGEGATGPLVPVYAATFAGASPALLGVMEAANSGTAVLGSFVWGRTSDEAAKRKPFLVLGFTLTCVALAGMALAPSFWGLVGWRALQGFATAAFAAVGGALVADRSRGRDLAARMGHLQMVGGLGYVAGLALGAAIVLVRPTRDLFGVAALLAMVSAVLALLLIREPDAHLRRGDVHRLFRNVTAPVMGPVQRRIYAPPVMLHRPKLTAVERRAWAYLAAIFITFLGTSSGFVLFPLYLASLGVSNALIFVLFLTNAGLSTLLYQPAGRLAERLGYRKLQLSAIGTRSAMFLFLAFPFARNVPSAVVFLLFAGASWAVLSTTGAAALFRGMEIRKKGELIGLYHGALGLGSLAGALLGGLLAQAVGYATLFLVAAALVAVGLVVTATVVYPRGHVDPIVPT